MEADAPFGFCLSWQQSMEYLHMILNYLTNLKDHFASHGIEFIKIQLNNCILWKNTKDEELCGMIAKILGVIKELTSFTTVKQIALLPLWITRKQLKHLDFWYNEKNNFKSDFVYYDTSQYLTVKEVVNNNCGCDFNYSYNKNEWFNAYWDHITHGVDAQTLERHSNSYLSNEDIDCLKKSFKECGNNKQFRLVKILLVLKNNIKILKKDKQNETITEILIQDFNSWCNDDVIVFWIDGLPNLQAGKLKSLFVLIWDETFDNGDRFAKKWIETKMKQMHIVDDCNNRSKLKKVTQRYIDKLKQFNHSLENVLSKSEKTRNDDAKKWITLQIAITFFQRSACMTHVNNARRAPV